jgi:hypothetical protein
MFITKSSKVERDFSLEELLIFCLMNSMDVALEVRRLYSKVTHGTISELMKYSPFHQGYD